ncbi:crotonase/enoyl-CoA hydratase family protein [Pseudonocardia ailaonensis]|uniref:Crotonase/enoyl-CoA hydratase family protein n=1 Tax=Pseudonocardia ailaonensis TaxID=367279 RepID=A0ABN2N2N2_9PSEU
MKGENVALVEYRPGGRVGEIVLNNPARRNALSPEMLDGLGAALDGLLADDAARVGIVRGEGPSFCSGVDVGAGSRYGTLTGPQDHARLHRMASLWLRFWDSPKPILAQVHGHCLAGALQLPLSCDIVCVADDAVIGGPKLPMGGGWIGPMLAHRIGPQQAKVFAFQVGRELTGREARDAGFAALSVPAADLPGETRALAERIALMPPDLLRIEKESINAMADAAGFRASVLQGIVWDALAHTSEGVAEARAMIAAKGVKGAIAEYGGARP